MKIIGSIHIDRTAITFKGKTVIVQINNVPAEDIFYKHDAIRIHTGTDAFIIALNDGKEFPNGADAIMCTVDKVYDYECELIDGKHVVTNLRMLMTASQDLDATEVEIPPDFKAFAQHGNCLGFVVQAAFGSPNDIDDSFVIDYMKENYYTINHLGTRYTFNRVASVIKNKFCEVENDAPVTGTNIYGYIVIYTAGENKIVSKVDEKIVVSLIRGIVYG